VIVPSSLPASFQHYCGGTTIGLSDGPYLVFRGNNRTDIAWRIVYACLKCASLTTAYEPLHVARIIPARELLAS
jgi:hypothetical protein